MRAVVATADREKGNEKSGWMCGRIPVTAYFPRLAGPGGRSRARHCASATVTGGPRGPARAAARAAEECDGGALGKEALTASRGTLRACKPATGRPRAGQEAPSRARRPTLVSRARVGRRTRSSLRDDPNHLRTDFRARKTHGSSDRLLARTPPSHFAAQASGQREGFTRGCLRLPGESIERFIQFLEATGLNSRPIVLGTAASALTRGGF